MKKLILALVALMCTAQTTFAQTAIYSIIDNYGNVLMVTVDTVKKGNVQPSAGLYCHSVNGTHILYQNGYPFTGTRDQMLAFEQVKLRQPAQANIALLEESGPEYKPVCAYRQVKKQSVFFQTANGTWREMVECESSCANNHLHITDAWTQGSMLYVKGFDNKEGWVRKYPL